ncbi:MAG: efflux RND transporter periplasmic adaptor subunit [Gallionellaceae bacterium]|jgi:cobalt-zinc-cadmium efflux system membrane fusion protein|nr:efflux RND transporter periplasmic adaptor subunit [Gallionellaceae bacterium]
MSDENTPAQDRHLPNPPPRPSRKYLVIGVIAVAVLLLAWWLFARSSGEHHAPAAEQAHDGELRLTKEQLQEITIVVAQNRGMAASWQTTGKIAVNEDRTTPVFSPYSGRVARVLVEPGAHVRAGQALLVMQAAEFADGRSALQSALAAEASAQAQLRVAQDNARRAQAIYQEAGGSLKDSQQAQSDLAAAQSAAQTASDSVAAARGKLAALGVSADQISALERAPQHGAVAGEVAIDAPIGGVITQRAVGVGQNVSAGGDAPLFVISDTASVWLVAQVPENESGDVRLGDAIRVTAPAYPGRTFDAKLDYVAPALDPDTHRLPVRATIANADGALKPEMFASFSIITNESDAYPVIPAEAVIHEGDSARVWVVGKDDVLTMREVKTGASADGQVQIVAGLKAGERLVTRGALFVDEAGHSQ